MGSISFEERLLYPPSSRMHSSAAPTNWLDLVDARLLKDKDERVNQVS
ncbi:hypothetical protein [Rhizobium sp. NFR03]|nr:hypothetical protein [Rhizobium sp. NFR03]